MKVEIKYCKTDATKIIMSMCQGQTHIETSDIPSYPINKLPEFSMKYP